jgi:hypothetical protein
MLVAAKFEEIYAPTVDDFVYISDNTYSRREILDMEMRILKDLRFTVKCATAKSFMARFLRAAGAVRGDMQTNLVKYLAELTLLELRFLQYAPSQVAAAALLTARRTLRFATPWTPTLEAVTGYAEAALEAAADDVAAAHRDAPRLSLRAITEKYSHSPYERVATAVAPLPAVGPDDVRSCAAHLRSNTY